VPEVEVVKGPRRGALSGESRLQTLDPKWVPDEKTKSAEQRYRLTFLLRQFFSLDNIPRSSLDKIVASAEQVYVAPAETVFKERDYNDSVYVVEKGMLECRKKGVDEEGRIIEEVIRKCAPGIFCGEAAIFESGRRRYSVFASEASMLWKVERSVVMHFVHLHATQTRARRFEMLRSVPLLHGFTDDQVMQLVDALQEIKIQEQDEVLVEGESNEKLCIVESGRCRAEQESLAIADYGSGAVFAELTLLQPAVNKTTVITTEPTTLLQLSRNAFTRMCGPLKAVLNGGAEAA
jgi:CRP-like cAMP-binding protein